MLDISNRLVEFVSYDLSHRDSTASITLNLHFKGHTLTVTHLIEPDEFKGLFLQGCWEDELISRLYTHVVWLYLHKVEQSHLPDGDRLLF